MVKESKKAVVLCDVNMSNREMVVRSTWLACAWARRAKASIIGWEAIPTIRRRGRLTMEREDLMVVARVSRVEAQMRAPRFKRSMLLPGNFVRLLVLLAAAFISPALLTRFRWDGLDIGQAIVDSQRRRTMAMDGKRFPVRRNRHYGYPVLPNPDTYWGRLLALNLFRFVVRAWILKIYWANFLDCHHVVGSVQLHVERCEYGLLTAMLLQKEIPVVVIERADYARLYDPFGKLILKDRLPKFRRLPPQLKSDLTYRVETDLHRQLFERLPNVHRTRTVGFTGDETRLGSLDEALYASISSSNGKCLLLLLTAPHEAYNHGRGQSVFFSHSRLLDSLVRVATRAGQVPIAVKAHPESHASEVDSVSDWLSRRRRSYSNIHLLPLRLALSDLAQEQVQWCAVSTESSAVIECLFLSVPVKIAEPTPYRVWGKYREPASRAAFEQSVYEACMNPEPCHRDLALEISLLTDYGLTSAAIPELLCPVPGARSVYPNTKDKVNRLNVAYAESSRGKMLRESYLHGLIGLQDRTITAILEEGKRIP